MSKSNKIAKSETADGRALLEQIAAGKTPLSIARELGCSQLSISEKLNKEPPETLRHARELGVETRLFWAKAAIERARNALELERAREAFKADMWLAECEFPERWRQIGSTRVLPKGQSAAVDRPMVEIVLSRPDTADEAKQSASQEGSVSKVLRPGGN
jgi:hypothetical protein